MFSRSLSIRTSNLASKLLDFCGTGHKQPGDGLRRIIKHGLKTGYFPMEGNAEFFTIPSVNALLEVFKKVKFYDFEFIVANQDKLFAESTAPHAYLELVYRMTGFGQFNAGLVLNACASIIKSNGLAEFTTAEKLKLLNVLARQRILISPLLDLISKSCESDIDNNQNSRRCRVLAELRISAPIHLCEERLPDTIAGCVDMCVAVVMDGIQREMSLTNRTVMLSCLRNMHTLMGNIPDMPSFMDSNPLTLRDIQLVRYALQFSFPELYSQLDDSILETFARIQFYTVSPTRTGRCDPSNSVFVDQLGQILFKSKIAYTSFTQVGPFVVDILERDSKVIWQCNGPTRFYATSTRQTTVYYDLQRMILTAMGYSVIDIPYWHWKRMRNRKVRSEYCRTSRHLAMHDIREHTHSCLATSRDPTEYNAKSSAVLQSVFLGETVFKKEQPRKSWSWHRPLGNTNRVSL